MASVLSIPQLFTIPLIENDGVFDALDSVEHLSDEFLGGGETYDDRYYTDAVHGLFADVLESLHWEVQPQRVLDVGSGSGNSVVAALHILPEAYVVATDLSPQLLGILRRRLLRRGLGKRCSTVRVDLSRRNILHDDTFDLVIGNSILHHILHPDEFLRNVCRWVRPGGRAVFIEPFASGQLYFGLLCERLAADADRLGISAAIADLFLRVANDIRVRLSRAVPYEYLEDKWLFTRTYLESSVAGLAEVSVRPWDTSPGQLVEHVRMLVLHGLGLDRESLPDAAWAAIAGWDSAYAPIAAESFLDGAIIIHRLVATPSLSVRHDSRP